jgi:hypothetical protein
VYVVCQTYYTHYTTHTLSHCTTYTLTLALPQLLALSTPPWPFCNTRTREVVSSTKIDQRSPQNQDPFRKPCRKKNTGVQYIMCMQIRAYCLWDGVSARHCIHTHTHTHHMHICTHTQEPYQGQNAVCCLEIQEARAPSPRFVAPAACCGIYLSTSLHVHYTYALVRVLYGH